MLLEGFPQADVSFEIVWVDMLPLDSQARAEKAASRLIGDDPRVQNFYDPEGRSGDAVADRLGWGSTAWDVYLFFPRGTEWESGFPTPSGYAHQLSAYTEEGFHTGEALREQLRVEMERIVSPGDRPEEDRPSPSSATTAENLSVR